MDNNKKLMDIAKEALENSYSPYSNFKVGAALLTKDGLVYKGANIENHGIQSLCAERCAFIKAISEGKKEFSKIAVCAKYKDEIVGAMPCGYCRQFMTEFCDKDFKVIVLENEELKEYSLSELLPHAFK